MFVGTVNHRCSFPRTSLPPISASQPFVLSSLKRFNTLKNSVWVSLVLRLAVLLYAHIPSLATTYTPSTTPIQCSLPLGFTFTDKGRCYAPLSVCLRFEEGQKGPVGNASVVPTKVTETKPTPAALQPAVEPEPTKDTVFKNPRVSLDHTTHNTGRTTTIELATFALHVLWLPLPIVLAYLNK
eukprot:TRINITY_DN1893_c0_g1_i2.p1 TRINITY_DN1893_c0_g1~~TRINITY_DN1893_c0_g1_i2.p1  ORF type:complete len:183 (+),score=18.97 TRINITY_DN1893_c0_g1_i2:143-691(+)